MRDRYHPELDEASVGDFTAGSLRLTLSDRLLRRSTWDSICRRNHFFQRKACEYLDAHFASCAGRDETNEAEMSLFSYAYAARDLFRFGKERNWQAVLGQIDPGPEEERIVLEEHERYAQLASSWERAPSPYWEGWREELELADRIIVNSEWSRACLLKEGVDDRKMEILPLVYREADLEEKPPDRSSIRTSKDGNNAAHGDALAFGRDGKAFNGGKLKLLFLGQINLRKGIGRLLDAMRLLKHEPVTLTLAGPSEIDSRAWSDLPAVSWIGPVPRSQVAEQYRRADGFILPTLSDGFALTQLEALGHGLPVIASKRCGEVVEDGVNGLILADCEPSTIAHAILDFRERLPSLLAAPCRQFTLGDLGRWLVGVD